MARNRKDHRGGRPAGRGAIKPLSTDWENPASAVVPAAELTPRPDPPADRSTRRIIMNIAGKRYELTTRTEVRVLTKGPAKVIEMPGLSAKKSEQ